MPRFTKDTRTIEERIRELAHAFWQERIEKGYPGTAHEDWCSAERRERYLAQRREREALRKRTT